MPYETVSTGPKQPPAPIPAKSKKTTTDPFWIGQAKINGNLCRVDWRILDALKEVSKLLKAEGADVVPLDLKIAQANKLGAEVALENPPGCQPEDPTDGVGSAQ